MSNSAIEKLREAFDARLIAEVKRHGGIPSLLPEEQALREAIAELLLLYPREGLRPQETA
jgi:hypothetical protein